MVEAVIYDPKLVSPIPDSSKDNEKSESMMDFLQRKRMQWSSEL